MFRADEAFEALGVIDWSESANAKIREGDRVLLYSATPHQFISHECLVTKTGIPMGEIIDDDQFWVDQQARAERNARTWMRLRLLHRFTDQERRQLTLPRLLDLGLNSAPQGRARARVELLNQVEAIRQSGRASDDALAEAAEADPQEVDDALAAMQRGDYAVEDERRVSTTRGSKQRAFADVVKFNYNYRCAITGISTRSLLVASHIVPWAEDTQIRLDPRNGICLSSLMDRAFDTGLLSIDEDRIVRVQFDRFAADDELARQLRPHDGQALATPREHPASREYLLRRRALDSL